MKFSHANAAVFRQRILPYKQPVVNLAMEDLFDLHKDPYFIIHSFFHV
jgi:hypothetical protein